MNFRVWDRIATRMLGWESIKHLPAEEIFSGTPDQSALNVMRCTGSKDTEGCDVYEGDVIENPDGIRMLIQYGCYQAFCPVDKCDMKSAGFYATAMGLPDMPVGWLEDYAKVVGNIYENPELWRGEV